MTRDDIIRMGREIAVQCCKRKPSTWTNEYAMSRIMELIDASIAAEREACAKVCDLNAEVCNNSSMLRDVLMGNAAAIRARGFDVPDA